jgi:hypothetical protein
MQQRARSWSVGVVVAAVLVGGALGGCSQTDERSSSTGDEAAADEAGGAGAGAVAEGSIPASAVDGGAALAGQQSVADDREVVYSGALTVRVDDAVAAAEDAAAVGEAAGGYLARSDAELDDEQRVAVVLRIPAASFEQVMADLGELGEVQARNVDSEDVTDQIVDLEGRLANARTSAERLRELLAKAENVQNTITIEDRLTQRQTEIEALTGHLEVLEDRVALATVDATFTERDEPAVSDDLPGPAAALRSGMVAVANLAKLALAAAAFALPFLPVVLLVVWLVRRGSRRRRRSGTDGPAAAVPPST